MQTRQNNFDAVLTAAVSDFAANGFDTEDRLRLWLDRLRFAALTSVVPEHEAVERVRAALTAAFVRGVERGGVLRAHPDISRFTLERVRPALHDELSRRVMASAQLIKNNREEAISTTLRRFSGWASSIPPGGSEAVDRREVKGDIRKSFGALSFSERRVAIDQGHKFVANLNDILAKGGDAIAGRWNSRFRVPNYHFRPEHKERDSKVYAIRDNWAIRAGLMNKGAGYTDEMTMPGEEVYCLPGDTTIDFFHDSVKAYRRRFSGSISRIITSSGRELCATPNHPVLTSNGWIAIGELHKGDDIIEIGDKRVEPSELDADDSVSCFADLFETMVSVDFFKEIRHGMAPDFHGDGTDEDVEIVSLAGPLTLERYSLAFEADAQLGFFFTDLLRSAVCSIDKFADWECNSSLGLRPERPSLTAVRVGDHASGSPYAFGNTARINPEAARNFFGVFPVLVSPSKFSVIEMDLVDPTEAGPEVYPSSLVPVPNRHDTTTDGLGDIIDGLSFRPELSYVVGVERQPFSGHVYNLQTDKGWYGANGIITKNCSCSYTYLYALRRLPPEMLTERGKAELERISRIAA